MSTKVYKYHLRAPVENVDEITRQLRLAQKYQHLLTTIERARRDAYVSARRELVGDVDLAEKSLEVARQWSRFGREYITKQHILRRSKKTLPEERARLAVLRDASKALNTRLKALKDAAKAHPSLYATATAQGERAHALRLAARKTFGPQGYGLHWGSYQLVEQACDAARKGSTPPAYRPRVSRGYLYRDEKHVDGQLSVQIMGGAAAVALTAGLDTRVQLLDMERSLWPTQRAASKGERWVWLYLRVGSKGRSPVWGVWPCRLHRSLPEEAVIKRATVSAKRRSFRTDWSLELTLDVPNAEPTSNPRTAALNPGWRSKPGDQLRVLYVMDSKGGEREVLLDPSVLWLFAKARSLQTLCDDWRNLTVRYLRAWLSTNPATPAWFQDAVCNVAQWKSNSRLTRFVERWRDHRFEGDETVFEVMWLYRARWRHLRQWADGCLRRAIARRREQYRLLAIELCSQYGTVVFDDSSYKKLAKREPVETNEEEAHQQARYHRQAAAPGELRHLIETAARSRGLSTLRVKPEGITLKCCEHDRKILSDPKMQIVVEYECGCSRDQDRNACRNILRRERSGDAKDPARKPRKNSRFDRERPASGAAE